MNGLMTEREWRKLAAKRTKARPLWWGAQYLMSPPKKNALLEDKAFRAFLLMLSLVIAVLLPAFVPVQPKEQFADAISHVKETAPPRRVSAIGYLFPSDMPLRAQTYSRDQLLRGKLMLLDNHHPLPPDAPAPNTFRIASYGSGMVSVRELDAKSGRETIHALSALFDAMRSQDVAGLAVWQGTVSAAQQQDVQTMLMRKLMQTSFVDAAYQAVVDQLDMASSGEMLQEYTVELRFRSEQNGQYDERPFSETRQGQTLLRTAWRYGFVRTHPDGKGSAPYRFRYVGNAHATAMTYLDLPLKEYLEWLHQKETLTISENGRVKYLISCKPAKGAYVEFHLPANAACEVSLDNMGYAVAACTLY